MDTVNRTKARASTIITEHFMDQDNSRKYVLSLVHPIRNYIEWCLDTRSDDAIINFLVEEHECLPTGRTPLHLLMETCSRDDPDDERSFYTFMNNRRISQKVVDIN